MAEKVESEINDSSRRESIMPLSLALLMKKTITQLLLTLSLAGVAIQMFHSFVISNFVEVLGPSGAIMPVMVVIIAIALVRLANKAKVNNWLS